MFVKPRPRAPHVAQQVAAGVQPVLAPCRDRGLFFRIGLRAFRITHRGGVDLLDQRGGIAQSGAVLRDLCLGLRMGAGFCNADQAAGEEKGTRAAMACRAGDEEFHEKNIPSGWVQP
ncbi:hypothetical protein KOEU_34180 [Komagataeibacter europaeus]|uniref:Uncharacterized protein n=1 Tax=Komagataeibacter europaeus TaxID=33995 RepID=A0A0M0ECV6_KOMEU|nr:hypothetical protein KOEU_34180 [Komagataeibacter europaeus]